MGKQLGVIGRGVLGLKLRMPAGVTLNDNEAQAVIDDWNKQIKTQETTATKMVKASGLAERQAVTLGKAMTDTAQTIKEAKTYFKVSKNPVKKQVWARRLVLATRTQKQLKESDKRLRATVERVGAALEDAKLVKTMLETRIEEAKIYRELNGGLKLVGQALVDARADYKTSAIEYTNFELNMEALEKEVDGKSREAVLREAERYLELTDKHTSVTDLVATDKGGTKWLV